MAEVKRSAILAWTAENIDQAPETPGVYVLRPSNKTKGYIGSAGTGRLRARLNEHMSGNDHPLTKYFDWYQHDSEKSARDQELAWIKKYDPPWNK